MTQVVDLNHSTDAGAVAKASVVRRRLGVLIDRLTGSGGLDPALLHELEEFLRLEAIPAAESYKQVLDAQWVAEGGPQVSACPPRLLGVGSHLPP